ncbi:DNA/RNA non-specific endonuclease [Enterococcus avium]|uniref:DNA/RNA non-specific endonuclease n=1 Tax=Enterococcus avium TaxID=33945 RepID=UPI000F5062F0|nr:DNA/RNA non-specific endonuclease [Enterococcus avium]MDT2432213.1 DNA/RNA non-specific endonuclease [Enterococcus avium]MDT2449877.1 DNA/RNA non-specific endonuclease [Enterococcus avium]MDT2493793.1 DNA/RNA non-specific endonuclease [Enterococcus avium]ROZ48234.1 DNA/RNA non-specific endonuclease [Enterococcus avium]
MFRKLKYWVRGVVTLAIIGFGAAKIEDVTPWLTQGHTSELVQTVIDKVKSVQTPTNATPNDEQAPLAVDQVQYEQLAALDFQSGSNAVYNVNNGLSTLDISQWQENKVIYGDLDALNRTTSVTAFIDQRNLGRSEGRERQVWQPTGWHQKRVAGKEIVNRGHLLAYTSSFNVDVDGNFKEGESGSQDNPKNLATQTAFSNQTVQTHYETLVRKAQKMQGNKVLFQIVTVFRGEELMPRGYWLQAIDSAGTLNFNVYEFNVQPKVVFHYADGTSTIDRTMTVSWNH